MTQCSICGRELTDPISVARGIGPECILDAKRDLVGQGTLFGARARYDYRIQGDALILYDLGAARSLTNDLAVALDEIEESEGDLSGFKIMYKDSYGEWTGVVRKGRAVTFFWIGGTDQSRALKILKKKHGA